jgi:hypothetical protein
MMIFSRAGCAWATPQAIKKTATMIPMRMVPPVLVAA